MRLKSLEIKGFKSFANQTVVNFSEDVIGIVGPNGSGKSNIVDAIRWVLGEQKGRELRLDKMSSVIFNGTKKRKAGNVASVSLTFENTKNLLPTDYNMVTITRMLYRSGESEYRLNGVTCRLKDIKGLLLDTGIGSNSYAIIALGMVDDILADKDNSRRRMFEQAAGVSKYKARKRETLNKLKNTEGDLDRIEDLLHEINNNLVSLEKQAKRARRYREIKAQYKELSVQLAAMKVTQLRTRYRELNKEITAAEGGYRATDASIKQLESKLEEARKENLDQEKILGERQRQLNEMVNKLRQQENRKQMLAQRLEFITRNRAELEQQIKNSGALLEEVAKESTSLTARISQEQTAQTELKTALEAAEAALQEIRGGHAGIKSQLDAGIQEQQQLERSIFELEKRRAINSNQIDNFNFQRERNSGEMEDRRGELDALSGRLTELEKKEKEQLLAIEKLETAEEERRLALEAGEEALDKLKNELNRINRNLDAKRNEFKLTKSMVENLEGFPESIRFLSQNEDWSKKAQLLSDLLLVDEGYRVAIENYLESYLNYYVVSDMDAAREAIQMLSRGQKGKANFFLLDAIDQPPASPALLPAGTRPAADVVQVDPEYRDLVGYLLGNVLVTESDEFPASDTGGQTILAKSGRFIRRPNSISGGSVGLFEGKKIGRKKNLEQLEKAIEKGEADASKLNKKLYEARTKVEQLKGRRITQDIQQQQRELNKSQQQRAALRARVENFEKYFTETNAKNDQLAKQVTELEKTNLQSEKDLTTQQQKIGTLRETLAGTDGNYRKLSEQLSQANADYNAQNINFIRQQNLVESLQKELDFKVARQVEIEAQTGKNREQLQQLAKELESIHDEQISLQKELEGKYQEKQEFEKSLNDTEQGYFTARSTINALEDELRKTNRKRQDTQVLVNQLKEKFTDVKFKISSMSERLRIEFDVDIKNIVDEAETDVEANQNNHPEEGDAEPQTQQSGEPEIKNQITSKFNADELELKVDRLRSRIANYGEINPMAVEAYDEMKERHDSITKQRDDILEAKESLLETINEIEETATVQFLEAFEKARLYFIDVFRSLFTEDDNCDLILLDPENPLESGIEIVAKPKGKRPQTISQLSGGEKTLTATALLFALYLLKPAPFCIFDEVDAPLDDANITKFNRIIKKFSKDSQFIIVTHNKLTMAAVDTIYGVHMAEQGVSAVTPVDFREFDGKTTFAAV
ncbi:chromosome segregation protein SMC [Lewinellaceae bacterium SD302]|nr:chromosome segregation protein SMC [Lewinellaceae bacterium SD302]